MHLKKSNPEQEDCEMEIDALRAEVIALRAKVAKADALAEAAKEVHGAYNDFRIRDSHIEEMETTLRAYRESP